MKPNKPNKLKELIISAIGLVKRGANQKAFITLAKASPQPQPPAPSPVSDDGTCPQCKVAGTMVNGVCKTCGYVAKQPGLSDVNSPMLTGAQGKPKGLARPGPGTDEHDAYKTGGQMAEPEKTEVTKDAVVALLEKAEVTELKKALDVANAEKRLLAERVEKIELARRNEMYIAKAAEFDYLPGAKPDDLGPLLSKIDAALTDPERQTFWTYLRSANQAIKHSSLFGERGVEGVGGLGTSEPEQALQKIARGKMEADPKLTFNKAYSLAITENPKLYEQYEADRRSATRR